MPKQKQLEEILKKLKDLKIKVEKPLQWEYQKRSEILYQQALQTEDPEEKLECLEKALAENKYNTNAWKYLKAERLKISDGLYDKASVTDDPERRIMLLTHSIKTNPESAKAHHLLGNTYMENQNIEEAYKHLKKALELDAAYESDRSTIDDLQERISKIKIAQLDDRMRKIDQDYRKKRDQLFWDGISKINKSVVPPKYRKT